MVSPIAWSWRATRYLTRSWLRGRIVIGAASNDFNAEPLFHKSRAEATFGCARRTMVVGRGIEMV